MTLGFFSVALFVQTANPRGLPLFGLGLIYSFL